MNIPEEPDVPAQINIIPMIDVIFAILTFFIMATLFLTRSEGLPVNLPRSVTAETQRQSKINVTVDAQGNISLNREPIQIQNLAAQVENLIGNSSQSLIVINADETVDHGRVVAVMDELRTVEGATLGIATKRPE
ncbi:biopolymer transporter ExbD [filamentous cyanobacterium CCP2]|nr:biopolymer transporter ExbD [filamentous cyanobacterium CCP2]